jgi:hypothetical protein
MGLGLMKNFMKSMNHHGEGFWYLQQRFPLITEAKIKEGIFVSGHKLQLIDDKCL